MSKNTSFLKNIRQTDTEKNKKQKENSHELSFQKGNQKEYYNKYSGLHFYFVI